MKLSPAQERALTLLETSPQKRGLFNSGWGPHQYGYAANRVDITEGTANGLISRGLAERWDVEDNYHESTLRITEAGRLALRKEAPDAHR